MAWDFTGGFLGGSDEEKKKNAVWDFTGGFTPDAAPTPQPEPTAPTVTPMIEGGELSASTSNVNPEFAAKHPTLNRILAAVSSPIRSIMETPWMQRAGQSGAEVMTLQDIPEKAATGSRFGDISADIFGGLMGFATNPVGGLESAGARVFSGGAKAVENVLPQTVNPLLRTGAEMAGGSLTYDAARALANERPINLEDAGISAAANALLPVVARGAVKLPGLFRTETPKVEGLSNAIESLPIVPATPRRLESPKTYRLPNTEQEAMSRLTEGIETAQNYLKHKDIYAVYPPGTTVEAALADIKANTGIDLPKLIADVEAVQARGGLRQQLASEAQYSRLGQAAGAIPQPTGLIRQGAIRPVGAKNALTESAQAALPQSAVGATKFTIPEKMAPVGEGQRVRSLGVSAMRADYTHPDVKAGLLMETYPGGAGVYSPITNKATIEQAQKMIASDVRRAERFAKENPGTALSNTISLELVKKANAEGRFDDAIDLIQEVSQRSTTQGQAIQSLRLWGKMTPEGMQRYYVKTVDSINKDLEKKFTRSAKKLQVKPEIMEQIKTNMEKIDKLPEGRERDIEIAKTLDLIASQVPVPFLRKVASIQTMAQLLNPKTAIRNIGGNIGFAGLENVSGAVGAAIDRPLSMITGQRTKVMPSLTAQAKGFKQGWKHGLEDALLGIDTSGIATKFDLPRGRVFRKGPLGFAEKALNIELRATDRAFYQAAYEESLLNQMRAAKTNTPTEEMRNIAHLDGLYRTFQDDNALSNLFVGIKRLLNAKKEFGVGDFIIKYPRTPANLLMRGLDYSPAGFVKVILEAARPLAKQKFNQKAFVEAFSRALVGSTALFGAGALLHKLGVITGRPAEDRDLAELQRQQGFGEYRINASALKRLVFGDGNTKPQKGDIIVSYDWFQPQAIPMAIGADIDANKGTDKGIAGTLLNALSTGINAFAEQPVVQGIQTLFSGGYGDWSKGIVKVLETVPSSFVPTLLSQIRQLVDNQRRETYSPDKGREALNRVMAKVPGLAGTLPQKYGTLGQPLETYQDGGNTPFNVFLNPAFVNTYAPSKEVQRVFDLYEQTGETRQVPRVVDKSITVSGNKFTLSGQEYAEYQRLVGEYTQQGFAKMPGNLKPEDAVKKMQDIMTDANTKAKEQILKQRGVRYQKSGKGLKLAK